MRRVVSLYLPHWPTDRLRRRLGSAAPSPAEPLVLSWREGNSRLLYAVDEAARRLGLKPGLTLAHARARVPGLVVAEADPAGDAAALKTLALWAHRHYSPVVQVDGSDGLWIEVTGAAHLKQGEEALVQDLLAQLSARRLSARAALAATPGGGHALARYGGRQWLVLPPDPGALARALAPLPLPALRLAPQTITGLHRLGLASIGMLEAAPRAPMALRFGASIAERLDQAHGRRDEPLTPVLPAETLQAALPLAEPVMTAEALATLIARLVADLCVRLEKRSLGARRLDLLLTRVDGSLQALRIGTARSVRDAAHLTRLMLRQIEQIDPGFGIEQARLVASLAEPLPASQRQGLAGEIGAGDRVAGKVDLAPLIDRLANRPGIRRLYRLTPVESEVPERGLARLPALAAPAETSWPETLPRPTRLLSRPEPVETMALLPDQPPVFFSWRGKRRRVKRADGPERIFGEWWLDDAEWFAVRDYFCVEDEEGRRFWLFRNGDGADEATGSMRWFLHGFFS
jgi:protein ImuB